MKLLKRKSKKSKYILPNPHPAGIQPEADPVRWEFWQMLMELHRKVGVIEGRQVVIVAIILAMLGAILAKVYA